MSEILAAGRYLFRDAEAADDSILRGILRATPLPGWVTLSFEREPDYFRGCAVEGDTRTILARTADGDPVGFFSRAVRKAWINGRPTSLGYLGQLRLLPEWRGRSRIILRGFQVCRELLHDGIQDTPYFLTSVLSDNTLARRILTAGIKGMPRYRPLSSYITLVASCRQPLADRRLLPSYEVITACEAGLDSLTSLLQDCGSRYALHPYWDADGLSSLQPVGWRPENTLLLMKNDRPVACGSVWDQRAVRQQRITGYGPALAYGRPLISAALGSAGFPGLPRPGKTLPHGYLSHLAVLPGEEAVLPGLIAALLRLAGSRGLTGVILGLSEMHPWLARLRKLRALRYRSQLYLVHWEEGRDAVESVAGQLVQTEVACL